VNIEAWTYTIYPLQALLLPLSLDQVRKALQVVTRDGTARGLVLSTDHAVRAPNQPKTTMWCPSAPLSLADDPLGLAGSLPK
jgi:hypothetical protein